MQRLLGRRITGTCTKEKLWTLDLSHSIHYELGNLVSYKLRPVSYRVANKKAVLSIKMATRNNFCNSINEHP